MPPAEHLFLTLAALQAALLSNAYFQCGSFNLPHFAAFCQIK